MSTHIFIGCYVAWPYPNPVEHILNLKGCWVEFSFNFDQLIRSLEGDLWINSGGTGWVSVSVRWGFRGKFALIWDVAVAAGGGTRPESANIFLLRGCKVAIQLPTQICLCIYLANTCSKTYLWQWLQIKYKSTSQPTPPRITTYVL